MTREESLTPKPESDPSVDSNGFDAGFLKDGYGGSRQVTDEELRLLKQAETNREKANDYLVKSGTMSVLEELMSVHPKLKRDMDYLQKYQDDELIQDGVVYQIYWEMEARPVSSWSVAELSRKKSFKVSADTAGNITIAGNPRKNSASFMFKELIHMPQDERASVLKKAINDAYESPIAHLFDIRGV